jgi:hypothetical protein
MTNSNNTATEVPILNPNSEVNLVGSVERALARAILLSQHTSDKGEVYLKVVAISPETSLLKKAYKQLVASTEGFDRHEADEFQLFELNKIGRKRRIAVALNAPKTEEELSEIEKSRSKAKAKAVKDAALAEKVERARALAEYAESDQGKREAAARAEAQAVVARRAARIKTITG